MHDICSSCPSCRATGGRPATADRRRPPRRQADSSPDHRTRAACVSRAAGANGVDRVPRSDERPEPVAEGAHPPPGFIRRKHRRVADLLAQRRVGRSGVAGHPMQEMRDAARRDLQANVVRSTWATFANGTPISLCNSTTSTTTPGPSCTPAAPSASDVCSAWRPCTRRRHYEQRPTPMSKRRTRGRTAGIPS